ncbi:hypothetical protein MPC4_210015 [Methylocella tundrae]|uniref:Uncharacterized protein n=1 Tax=Methylocella tundrae TaxID=227605 RepID=A0A8B6M5V4_METTU|nr:hypothetical protein MPC1_2070002 [Methylocella tundrae]VTZ50208.1 hypothetical protein MPC4_210015 [Methylocella tundrae]
MGGGQDRFRHRQYLQPELRPAVGRSQSRKLPSNLYDGNVAHLWLSGSRAGPLIQYASVREVLIAELGARRDAEHSIKGESQMEELLLAIPMRQPQRIERMFRRLRTSCAWLRRPLIR